MVTVSGNPNPINHTNPTNPITKYRCEFVNLNCIFIHVLIFDIWSNFALIYLTFLK